MEARHIDKNEVRYIVEMMKRGKITEKEAVEILIKKNIPWYDFPSVMKLLVKAYDEYQKQNGGQAVKAIKIDE